MSRLNYMPDSPDLSATGSNLLSLESLQLPSDASFPDTGRKHDDFSFSELSTDDHTVLMNKPFSLLAPTASSSPVLEVDEPSTPTRKPDDDMHDEMAMDDQEIDSEGDAATRSTKATFESGEGSARREDKLRSDMFILRKLNAAFEQFNEALQDTQTANERITAQLAQTDALLNKYIKILGQSEEYAKLIFDEEWGGFSADYEEGKRIVEEQKRKEREEEERRRQKEEEERLAKERREQQLREEQERLERESKAKPTRGSGVRGVRGTRASMRGARGASSTARPDAAPASSSRGTAKRQSSIPTRTTSGIGRGTRPPS